MIVQNILETKPIQQVVTVKPADTVMSAVETLTRHKIGAVVVSPDGEVVSGILSERDIVKAIANIGVECLEHKVSQLMTSQVVACAPDDTAISALERMTDGRFRHMPVVADGKMAGLISIGDVVKARISEIQQENSALTGMIANAW
jgi:CBS domain-containing protein